MITPDDVMGGRAFLALPADLQDKILRRLSARRHAYMLALQRGYSGSVKAIILGDKPGPGRPTTAGFHFTPFFSTRNSSLWLNKMLEENDIDESRLLWFNVEMADGSSLDPIHLEDMKRFNPTIICLGGQAEMWMRRNAPTSPYVKVFHPQYAKRFRSNEPYALIDELKKALK